MRRIALPLLLASLLSLAFAPAPLPRRGAQAQERRRAADASRRLKEVGATWQVEEGDRGRTLLVIIPLGGNEVAVGRWPVNGDVPGALRKAATDVEDFLRSRGRR